MIFQKIRTHIFSFIYILLLSSIAFPQMQDVAKIKVEDKSISIQQGENFSINVSITVDATWHINSNKPNDDFLIPTEISARGNGLKLISVNYPICGKETSLSATPL